MSEKEKIAKVDQLVEQASKLLGAGQPQDASALLREATTLDPDNSRIKAALIELQDTEAKPTLIDLCRKYVHSANEEIGERAVQAAKNEVVAQETVDEVLDILLGWKNPNSASTRGKIVGALLHRSSGLACVARLIHARPTEIYRKIWALGDESLDGLIRCLLTANVWDDEAKRKHSMKDVFLLLLSQLLYPGIERHDILLRGIARLIAASSENVESVIDAENLEIILSFLDIEQPAGVRSQATLTVAKFLEASQARGQALLTDYVTSRIGKPSNNDLVAAFSVAGAIFPVVPDVAAKLFLTPGFTEDLTSVVQRSRSTRLKRAILELLSAACIDKNCRKAIRQDCDVWLMQVVRAKAPDMSSQTAALVLSKVNQEDTTGSSSQATSRDDIVDELVPLFKDTVLADSQPALQVSIEGLAYSSVQPKVKEDIANDSKLLEHLVKTLQDPEQQGGILFGGLTIFSNLTAYPPVMSAEDKRMAQLKAYANQTKPAERDPLESDLRVTARCKKVLDAGIAPLLISATKRASPVVLNLIASVILSLSKNRNHSGVMLQQGLLDTILILGNLTQEDPTNNLIKARRAAGTALAKVLLPVDPELIFQSRPVEGAIRALNFVLADQEPSDPQSAFDALRALTNLASMSDATRNLIVDRSWPLIEVLLDSPLSAMQQAAIECVSNLTHSEAFCLKFISQKPEDEVLGSQVTLASRSASEEELRFLRILAFTRDEFRWKRLAAMAALSNITAFAEGVVMLARSYNGLQSVVDELRDAQTPEAGKILGTENAKLGDIDMRIRALAVLANVVRMGRADFIGILKELDLASVLADGTATGEPPGVPIKEYEEFIRGVLEPP